MLKAAIIVLADTENHSDIARVVNALKAVKEFKEAGDEVQLIFDGAGTKWVSKLTDTQNQLHPLFDTIKDKVAGVCSYCAVAFGAADSAAAGGVNLLKEYEDHPSFRDLVFQGYEIITF